MQGTVTSKVRDFSIKYANYLQTSMPELKNDAIKSLTFLRLPERHELYVLMQGFQGSQLT